MDYKEDEISKSMVKLNAEYLDVYYSKAYQKYVNKRIKKIGLKKFFLELSTGYFLKRIKGIITGKTYEKMSPNMTVVPSEKYKMLSTDERVAVYTVIIGDYDELKEPLYLSSQCDYYVVSDCNHCSENTRWKFIEIQKIINVDGLTNTQIARFVKTHPEVFFPEYKYSIFLDGNFLIVGDLLPLVAMMGNNVFATHSHICNDCIYQEAKDIIALGKGKRKEVMKQINAYKKEGFPSHYGLFETNVLVREHNSEKCKMIDSSWWEEMKKYTYRDQLSLTYVLWKTEIGIESVSVLGSNPRKNPRLRYLNHK